MEDKFLMIPLTPLFDITNIKMKFVQASKLAFSTHTILCSSPDIFFVFVTFKTIQYLSRPLNLFHSEILML